MDASNDEASSDESSGETKQDRVNSEDQNMQFYKKASGFKAAGQLDEALKYFTKCLEGIDKSRPFTKLPQCLREIAAIYYDKEECESVRQTKNCFICAAIILNKHNEKAVQFAQAEKLYYEAALIDSSSTSVASQKSTTDNDPNSQYIQKAIEYEQLATLCLQQQKVHLALEYCGKVAKIRQSVLGPSNPATIRSLDLFTVLYAEAGRQQYADALKVAQNPPKMDENIASSSNKQENIEVVEEPQPTENSNEVVVSTKSTTDTTATDEPHNSSIICPSRTFLLFFIFSTSFVIMLSLWIQ